MDKDFYISLITKKLSNELDASQLKALSSWMGSDKSNGALVDDFKSVWSLSNGYKKNVSFNADSAFQSFASKYDIPKADPSVLQAFAKKKISFSIRLPILIISALLILSLLYFAGVFSASKITNDNMHVMAMQLDEFSSLTLAPNATYKKGDAAPLNADKKEAYASHYALIESKKSSRQVDDNSLLYLPVTTIFEPSDKNYMIEDFEGKGFFELKSINENQAFLGLGNGISIGTRDAAFNLQNYQEDNDIILDVQKGMVVWYDGRNNAYIVKAGERAVFNRKDWTLAQGQRPKLDPYKWHKGILMFDNTPLPEVFQMIERFYGVDVEVTDQSNMDDINFTATLSMSSNLNDCLDLLHESIEMTIRRKGLRDIEISDIKSN